jgi:hypothetical protein
LDEAYERTLLGIEEEKRIYARCLFQCLSVSFRPLRVEELAAILADRFDAHPKFSAAWRRENAQEAVLSACSSLIMIADGEGGQVVQFSHVSVKEFLTSDRLAKADERFSFYHILPEPAHTLLAQACLGVLSRLDDKIDRNAIGHFPLAQYAARHWVDHAQIGRNMASRIEEGMERLFDPIKPHFAAWVWLYDIDRHWVDPMSGVRPTQPEAAPLYYAALCGFVGLVERLLVSHSSDINCRGGSHTTPLHAATVKGHVEVISLLLRSGADPNTRDNLGRVPLHKVTDGGHFVMERTSLEITRLLFNSGANVNVTDDEGCSPLHAAARNGYREVVQQLVEFGASPDARNQNQQTPLPRPPHQKACIYNDALIQDLYPENTIHVYNLKSRRRDYAIITVKSHARTALDTPLLYFGEEVKGSVILSLNNLSDMQNMDVAVSRLFFDNVTTIELGTRSCRFLIRTPISHRSRPGASCYRIRSMSLISQAESFVGPLPLRRQPIPSRR